MRDASTTRRGFLAAAGTTLFAGCSGLDSLSSDSPETIRSYRLSDLVDEPFEPVVVESVPVAIERARLSETSGRVTELLRTLPMPFGPDAVPNGHVRQRLVDAAADASESVEQARTARTRLRALRSLRDARARARYAAAGWAFADGTATDADLRAEYLGALNDAEALRTDHRYLGGDLVDAALVHARIERNLDRVGASRRRRSNSTSTSGRRSPSSSRSRGSNSAADTSSTPVAAPGYATRCTSGSLSASTNIPTE